MMDTEFDRTLLLPLLATTNADGRLPIALANAT